MLATSLELSTGSILINIVLNESFSSASFANIIGPDCLTLIWAAVIFNLKSETICLMLLIYWVSQDPTIPSILNNKQN